MADSRKPVARITLQSLLQGGAVERVECFRSEDWGVWGRFRLRVNGRWLRPRSLFCPLEKIEALLVAKLRAVLQARSCATDFPGEPPELPQGCSVSAPVEYQQGLPTRYEQCVVKSTPVLTWEGVWVVAVYTYGRPLLHVPVQDLRYSGGTDGP